MKHVKALVIKFLMIAAVLVVILTLFFDVPFMDSIWTGLVVTVLGYIIGDLLLFRLSPDRMGITKRDILATIGDLVISFLAIWYMLIALTDANSNLALGAFLSALVIAGGEWFFHKYLERNVFTENYDSGSHIPR